MKYPKSNSCKVSNKAQGDKKSQKFNQRTPTAIREARVIYIKCERENNISYYKPYFEKKGKSFDVYYEEIFTILLAQVRELRLCKKNISGTPGGNFMHCQTK